MSVTTEKSLCECYKKLGPLDIPLYKADEQEEYAEGNVETPREKAFPVPDSIRIDEKCKEYPFVGDLHLSVVFRCMSETVLGLSDFDMNILSFWILDMFIEGLWTAQSAGMKHDHQKATLLWIAYFFNYILKRNPTRKQLFHHLKEILFLPEGCYDNTEMTSATGLSDNGNVRNNEEPRGENDDDDDETWPRFSADKKIWNLPLPPVLEELQDEERISWKTSENSSNIEITNSYSSSETLSTDENLSDLNVAHMNVILGILYRIFGRLWVYLEIQSTLHNMPTAEIIDLPFKLHTPKPKAPLKTETPAPVKSGKKGVAPEKSPEEIEAERQLHKNDYILPLQESDEAKALIQELFGSPGGDKKSKADKNK